MVYVVECYLPGLSRANLLPRLSRLEPVTDQLRAEGSAVRYLGATIVLEDEACFCQFESSSETEVAEASRRAGLPFDRIVPALLVQPNHRSAEMSVSTSVPKPARVRQSHAMAALAATVAVVALAAWMIASHVIGPGPRLARPGVPSETSVLRSLTPQERQHALGILSLTPAQFQAAFGTSPTSVRPGRSRTASPPVPPSAPTLAAVLRSLTPGEREYVVGILSLTPAQFHAAFGSRLGSPGAAAGSNPASSTTTSPSVASPTLPACGPGPCWHAATGTGRSAAQDR